MDLLDQSQSRYESLSDGPILPCSIRAFEIPSFYQLIGTALAGRSSIRVYDFGSAAGYYLPDVEKDLAPFFPDVTVEGFDDEPGYCAMAQEDGYNVRYMHINSLSAQSLEPADLVTLFNPQPRHLEELLRGAHAAVAKDGIVAVFLNCDDLRDLLSRQKLFLELDPEKAWALLEGSVRICFEGELDIDNWEPTPNHRLNPVGCLWSNTDIAGILNGESRPLREVALDDIIDV